MNAGEVLNNALSPDANIRAEAEKQLEAAARDHWSTYLAMLSQELANEQSPSHVRNAAGLALKNALTAKEESRKEKYIQQWLALDAVAKNQIKQTTTQTLSSSETKAGQSAAQFIAAIAAIELPRDMWPELMATLVANVTEGQTSNVKQASLQAIGYICETVDPQHLMAQSNAILTAVVQGVRADEPDPNVRFAAINSLFDSLEFIRENFEREGERNFIMQVVCEATQSQDTRIQIAAFGCLVRIMQLYYDKMRLYMEKALYGLTIMGMRSDNADVALQAVEFWSTVCEEEIEVMMENQEASEVGEPAERQNFNFAKLAMPEILPILFELLMKQDEDADEDEWNPSMAAGICIQLFAQCVEGQIVPPVLNFVELNIRSEDWRRREAAVMAFGSILEGPEAKMLEGLVQQALPVLISMMSDPVVNVKDTTAWALGRITDLCVEAIAPEVHLPNLMQALLNGLNDNPRIIANCCWAIMNLSEQLGSTAFDHPTSTMSPYYEQTLTTLMNLTSGRSGNENNALTSMYEAIATMVSYAAVDLLRVVSSVLVSITDRLEPTIEMRNQIIGQDDRAAYEELQSNILSVLTSCVRRLGHDVQGQADRIMTILLELLRKSPPQSIIHEDVFLAVGSMTSALESSFSKYVESFMPFLYAALSNPEEHQLCAIAVGLVGDLSRALGSSLSPYCDTIMQRLFQNLQSPLLMRTFKPAILSCTGDIALAIGPEFEKYLSAVMLLLQQAATVHANPEDGYEMIDYVSSLRESVVEAYTGIVQALKSGNQVELLLPHLQHIFGFLSVANGDLDRTETLHRCTIGLLGDLAGAFPNRAIAQLFQQDWITDCLKEARNKPEYSQSTRDVTRWAREQIRQQCI